MKCYRCRRPLRNPVIWQGMSFGSTCAKAVGAPTLKKRAVVKGRGADFDPRQIDMWGDDYLLELTTTGVSK